jgi:hypothetical protein
MESLSTIRSMVGELCFIKTKKYIKGNGKMIKRKVLEYRNSQMDVFIRGIIKMENLMERAAITGVTARLMMESGKKEKDTGSEHGRELMETAMKANGDRENQMVQGLLQAMVTPMKDSLRNLSKMALGWKNLLMETCTEEAILMACHQGREHITGQIRVILKEISSMD